MGLFGGKPRLKQKDVWRQFAEEIEGDYLDGGLWTAKKVISRLGDWTVTLDTFARSAGKSTVTYTRIRAPFICNDGLEFKLYKRSIFSGIGQAFGMQNLDIGYGDFDGDFILKGDDQKKLQKLFANEKIRNLILTQKKIHLGIKDSEGWLGTKLPEDVYVLYFERVGIIKDIDVLRDLYLLFGLLLNQLYMIGISKAENPEIVLK